MEVADRFGRQGYFVARDVLDKQLVEACKKDLDRIALCQDYIEQSVNLRSLFGSSPHRFGSDISIDDLPGNSIFIGASPLGDSELFRQLIASEALWHLAAQCLRVNTDNLVLHFVQVIRKAAMIGPTIKWHRDHGNKFLSTAEPTQMMRILIPLQVSNRANGCTSIVPPTAGTTDQAQPMPAIDAAHCNEHSASPTLQAGDALAIDSRTIHGSDRNTSEQSRDQITVQFAVAGAEFLSSSIDANKEPYHLSTYSSFIDDQNLSSAVSWVKL